ncbi:MULTISPECIES: hypothetical protein [Cyanophyceae]|uniref:hypothetical protein n=1 Tax=Cyanophyceae TaxID=3028117 RepID=UPI00168307F7|nr:MULTISPECIES: hypothetical protein [Cyanophyceae]MBD1918895.1 hypothetical protein [Phormidium sp. FACHB-77]MBD2033263.1 hypothetical protein [Phormidium sp. FACHB-322]MBD2053804.1 hypothetical protein [Leptolyngbya sp. FACHB-60]
MSTLTTALIPAEKAKCHLEQLAGRRLPKQTLQRWRKYVGAELQKIQGRYYYTREDLANCGFLAEYLKRDRNVDRAVVTLFEEFRK